MASCRFELMAAASVAVLTTGMAIPAYAQSAAGSPGTARQQKPAGDDAQGSSSPLATQPTSNNSTANGPDSSNATAADGVPTQGPDDIIVTAQRREQRLQEAPVAVTALSEGALEQLNVSNTQALMTVVPSLQATGTARTTSRYRSAPPPGHRWPMSARPFPARRTAPVCNTAGRPIS